MEQILMDGWEFTLGEPEDGSFRPVVLPHDWAVQAPINRRMEQGEAQGFLDRRGIGWYRRRLELVEVEDGFVYFLSFDGIYENSTVWVNGKEAGGRKYGYSGFALDVTEFLHAGENMILVKADNSSGPADRWYSGAGIYRTVRLIKKNRLHLNPEELVISTRQAADGSASVAVALGKQPGQAGAAARGKCQPDGGNTGSGLDGSGAERKPDGETENHPNGGIRITALLFEAAGCVSGGTEAGGVPAGWREIASGTASDGILRLEVPSAKLWSPEEPNLYLLRLSLAAGGRTVDVCERRVGIRDIQMEAGKGMLLNGGRIKLKGVCVHQDAGCLGIAVPEQVWRERLLALKRIGCNAVRAAHHVFAPEFLELCDELGLLVYEEAFDKWTGGSYGRYFETEWRRDLEYMVKRDRNHPCIFMWGVGNEVEHQGQESMLEILRMLKECVTRLDASRPVSYAMNPHFKFERDVDLSAVKDIQAFVDVEDDWEIRSAQERLRRIGKIGEIVDVICCNYQEQWYPAIHEALPHKLILGTEIYQYFKGHEEQLQNFTEEVPWLDAEKYEYCIGGMLWTGIDYLGESMGYPSKGWAGSLFWTNGRRKPLSYLYESYWSDRPMVYFSVMDQTLPDEMVKEMWDAPPYAEHWDFAGIGKAVIPYMIASNCEEVALFLNGKRYYVGKPAECRNRMITGWLPYQPGEVSVRGYIGGGEVCRHTLRTPGQAAALRFERESIAVKAKSGFTEMLSVYAADREGAFVYHEDRRVKFSISGPAVLAGVDNGDLRSPESYKGTSMPLYRGCVSAAVMLTGEPGSVVLTASAEGLEEAVAVICAE